MATNSTQNGKLLLEEQKKQELRKELQKLAKQKIASGVSKKDALNNLLTDKNTRKQKINKSHRNKTLILLLKYKKIQKL
ncbi:MAG: hypothetical protein RCG15_04145 [Candidatus Rickettsia vulgarisii]